MTTEEFVRYYRKHPDEFIELMYDKRLYWYQKVFIKTWFKLRKTNPLTNK